MSRQTRCDYCILKEIRAVAKKKEKIVTILADTSWAIKGLNVYVHLPSVIISELEGGEDGERAKYRQAWMTEIMDHCSC